MTSPSQMAHSSLYPCGYGQPQITMWHLNEVRLMPWSQSCLVHAVITAVSNVSYVTCDYDTVHDFGFLH